MAGLNFSTQTIINSNLDPDSSNKGKEVKLFGFSEKENALRIKRDFVFAKDDARGKVTAIRKAEGYDAIACEASIDFDAIVKAIEFKEGESKKYCRLDIYLGVEGAEPFIYSTPWVQKGMPFWVEFTVAKNAKGADVAAEVAKILEKNHIFLVDKDLIHVEVAGAVMSLVGATEYQRFRNVEVLAFDVDQVYADSVAKLGDAAIELVERGKNAFGTYSQIVKDLRLPTAANYQWTHIRQVETPIVGSIYNQYIIEYCAPSTNEGLGAVGARLESHTTHVFWVKNDADLIAEWEEALGAIGFEAASTVAKESELKA